MEKSRQDFDFGRNLLILRKKRKLTQEEIAAKIHAKSASIGHWENNIHRPSQEKIELLAEVLGTTVPELLGYEKPKDLTSEPKSLYIKESEGGATERLVRMLEKLQLKLEEAEKTISELKRENADLKKKLGEKN